MMRALLGAVTFLMLGALTAFASRASASESQGPICTGCLSGVENYHPIYTMTDSYGNICYVTMVIWRQDGNCKSILSGDGSSYTCEEEMPCQFFIQSHCTCGQDCQNIMVTMMNIDGTLIMSFPSEYTTNPFGLRCDWTESVVIYVHNVLTNKGMSQVNGFSCDYCDIDPYGGDGGG